LQKWEYLIIRYSSHHSQWMADGGAPNLGREEELSAILNELGREGWEMVNANGINNISCVALKRLLPTPIRQVVVIDDGCSNEAPTKPRRGRPPKGK